MEDGARAVVIEHNPVSTQVAGAPSTPGDDDTVQDLIRQDEVEDLESELEGLADDPPNEDNDDNVGGHDDDMDIAG
jgi:uncharacterized ferredoxin-like protein